MCLFLSSSYSLLLNYLLQKVVLAKVLHRFNISYTAVSHLAFCTSFGRPASCVFPMMLRSGASRSATLHRRPAQKQLRSGGPASCVFPMVLRHGGPASCLFTMALCRSAAGQLLPPAARTSSSATAPRPATSSRQLSATVPPSSSPWRPGQQQASSGGEKYSGLASNLAHLGRIC